MSVYSPPKNWKDDGFIRANPSCVNCREIFNLFSETEAKRFNAVEIHLPFWVDLVEKATAFVKDEEWLKKANQAVIAWKKET